MRIEEAKLSYMPLMVTGCGDSVCFAVATGQFTGQNETSLSRYRKVSLGRIVFLSLKNPEIHCG
jgi:hypothetical protein